MKITSPADLAEVMGNLAPDEQQSRMAKHLEMARAAGMPDSVYQAIRQELDDGYLDIAKDSLLAWRARETRSHGGRSQLPGIQAAVDQILDDNPNISNKDAWKEFPQDIETTAADYEIYVDGNRLVQVNIDTKEESSISRRSFEDYYLAPARKSRSM